MPRLVALKKAKTRKKGVPGPSESLKVIKDKTPNKSCFLLLI
jgi:hypothetical protein